MKTPLKLAVQHRFEYERLNDERIEALRTLLGSTHKRRQRSASGNFLLSMFGVLLASILSGLFFAGPDLWVRTPSISAIADEIAANHLHHKPLESKSNDIDVVNDFFNGLGIRLNEPALIVQKNWRLMGGRYCSIQGVSAAQLRYAGKVSNEHTVYQAPYLRDRHGPLPDIDQGERPLVIVARGVEVTIWVQGGTLYAIADDGRMDHPSPD